MHQPFMTPRLSRTERTTYMPHNKKQAPPVITFDFIGPPSSPPIITLLAVKITKVITVPIKNTNTVKPNLPAGTM